MFRKSRYDSSPFPKIPFFGDNGTYKETGDGRKEDRRDREGGWGGNPEQIGNGMGEREKGRLEEYADA
jgi:hypothetical protein